MPSRRASVLLAAGASALAGCGGGDSGTGGGDDDGGGGTPSAGGPGLDVEASDAAVAPGETARVEVLAFSLGRLTWQTGDLPADWTVRYEAFDPAPTAVEESDPPALLWDPAASEVTGVLTVTVPSGATPDFYILSVEGSSADGSESVVSEAGITVEG